MKPDFLPTASARAPMHSPESISLHVPGFGQLALVVVGLSVAPAQGFGFQADAHRLRGVARGEVGAGPTFEVFPAWAVPSVTVRYRQEVSVAQLPFAPPAHVTAAAQVFHQTR